MLWCEMIAAPVFVVEGQPIAQGSKRALHVGVVRDDSPELKPWRHKVATVARANGWREPIDGPVALGVAFVRQRPRAHFKRGVLKRDAPAFPTGPRDLDKLLRAIFDALTGVCWCDDARVVVARPIKLYGPVAGAAILVRPIQRPLFAGQYELDLTAGELLVARVASALLWWPDGA